VVGGLTCLAGVLAGLGAARTPGVGLLWVALGIAVVVLLSSLRCCAWPRWLALFLGGLALTLQATHEWQALCIVPAANDTRLLLEGMVVSVPARVGAEWRFDADVRPIAGHGDRRPRRARLAWREAPVAPRVGERWRWLVRLSPASESRNFAGIDVERVVFRDRVHLTGRILPAAINGRLVMARSSVDTWRARIVARISDSVADPDVAALLAALAVGVTSGMSADQWRVFNATGTTHLVAISGLHVTLFALLAMLAGRGLWRCLPTAVHLDREPFAILLALAAAGGYALLAGFSVPTQRTWLMLAIFALARLGARHVGAGLTWSLALAAVLLLDVLAPLAAGFWLSFIAVGVILAIGTSALTPESRARRFARVQFAVTLALAPLTFAVFGGVSVVGLAVNCLAIPIVSFVFVPLVLAGALAALTAPAACGAIFSLAAGLHEWLWPALVWAADLELAQWRAVPRGWWYALAAPASVLLLWRWPWPLHLTAVALLLSPLFTPSRLPPPGMARVTVFDAGRGAVMLIATHTRVLLFDTGDAWNTRGTRMAHNVFPALDALGRRRVDVLVLPTLNEDRARAAALLDIERGVDHVVVGGGWPGTSLPASRCADLHFEWDGVLFDLLAAGAGGRFCVLRMSVGGHVLLAGGDLDAAAERELLARLSPTALASDVAILGRQANSTGSSPGWIEASVAGRDGNIVIAAGGITGSDTHARALLRWRDSGSQVFDTQRDGAVEFGFGTQGVTKVTTARSARWPFAWRRIE
jgi:competence protein ComEC